jgi:hypothetical protein
MAFKMKYKGFPKETKYLDDKENPKDKPPGYEPPVKRSDLDAEGKAIWDKQRETNFDSRIETEAEVKKANALEDANQGHTPGYTHRVPKAHGNK